METQTAMPQILAHEVARLKRVEFLEARLQTRSFHSFGTGHRCIPPQAPRAGLLKRELRPFIFALTVRARSEDTPPMLKVVEKQDAREVDAELLLPDEIARAGARAHGTSGSKTIGSALCRINSQGCPGMAMPIQACRASVRHASTRPGAGNKDGRASADDRRGVCLGVPEICQL